MPTIDSLIERSLPVTPGCTGIEVLGRFEREPDTLAIAVVRDGKPLGLIERDSFLRSMAAPFGHARFAGRSVERLMDPEPVTIEAAVDIGVVGESMLSGRASSLMRAFIVTDQGRYVGVGSLLSLLQATTTLQRDRALALQAEARHAVDDAAHAEMAARQTSRFVSILSKELRTPLNGVVAVAELLQRQALGEDARAYVQTIKESGESLIRILAESLDLARVEAGEFALAPAPTLIRTIVDDIQATWGPRAAHDGVSLLASYDGDGDLAAHIDGIRLRQVLDTLVGDALSLSRQGVVEALIRTVTEGDQVRITALIRDNGMGAGELARRLDASETDLSAASLGVTMCRRVLSAMSGRIWAETNAGGGSTIAFEVVQPRAFIETEQPSNVAELSELHLQSQPRVLIVDDNATNRIVAQALCEMFGCASECAEDGLEAVEAVERQAFDLILMDIKMPRMDGVAACRAIRALEPPARDIPIIALTANADPDDARSYLAIGMAAVVEKPIKPERLRQAMNLVFAGEPQRPGASQDEAETRRSVA